MCVVSCAHQPYFVLLGYPRTGISCPKHLGPPSIVSFPFEDPPRLPQVSRVVFSSLSQDLALGRDRWDLGGGGGRLEGTWDLEAPFNVDSLSLEAMSSLKLLLPLFSAILSSFYSEEMSGRAITRIGV